MSLKKSNEQRYLESSEYQRTIEQAKEKLSFKPFAQLYKNMFALSNVAQMFLPGLSILFAVAFVASWFSFLNYYVAIALAISVLAFIEVAKNDTSNKVFQMHYANIGSPVLTGLFVAVLSVVSFVTSYNGAETLVKQLTDKTQIIESDTRHRADSLNAYYNTSIMFNTSKIDSINNVAKKQWHGLTSKEQNKQINNYLELNKHYANILQNELNKLTETEKANKKEAKEQTFYAAHWSKILAAFIELALLLSVWFTNYYNYKTVQQHIDLSEFEQETGFNRVSIKTYQPEPLAAIGLKNQNTEPDKPIPGGPEPDKKIGFKFSTENVNGERVELSSKVCKHCGKEFEKKHWNAKYCSDECRIAAWEERTGKKMNLKK